MISGCTRGVASYGTFVKHRPHWLASPEAIRELKEAGFRNPEQARKLLDTILQKCEDDKRLCITPGYAYLSKNSTIALGGLSRYLARLFDAGFINLKLGEKGGGATMIELVLHNVNSYTPDGTTIHVVQNWNIYREHRDSEAFINNHYAYISTRTKATLKPLGANGLGGLIALILGPVTIQEGADIVGYSYAAMARTLRAIADHGLAGVEVGGRNRKTYTIKEEWRTILLENIPLMTTYAVQLVRCVDALKSRAIILEHKGEGERAEEVWGEYGRMEASLAEVKAEAGIIPFVHRGKNAVAERVIPLNEKRIKLSTEGIAQHRQRRSMTDAEKWRRKEYAKDIVAAGFVWDELNAWAKMEHGPGWWLTRDKTEIMGQYRLYEIANHSMPTIHWQGTQPVAVA